MVSGFSGTGKGTLMERLMKTYDRYVLSISMTTRDPRPGEVEGVNYFYVTDKEFEKEIAENGLLEYAGYVGHYYGTPKKFVEEKRDEGKDVFLEIEVQGAAQIKKQYPEAILVFVITPDAQTLENRLSSRNTEDDATITKRLTQALKESASVQDYDYLLINDDLDECTHRLDRLIQEEPEELRMSDSDLQFVERFMRDLEVIIERRKAEGKC